MKVIVSKETDQNVRVNHNWNIDIAYANTESGLDVPSSFGFRVSNYA